MNRSDLDQLTATLIRLDADGSVIDAVDLNRTLRDQAGVTAQRASSSIARVARAMRGGLSSDARRQARRRQAPATDAPDAPLTPTNARARPPPGSFVRQTNVRRPATG